MMIEAKKILNLPIAAMDAEAKVGSVMQLVIDVENGNLLGFLVKGPGFFSTVKALSAQDISEWDPHGLVTTHAENIVEPEEIVRIEKNRNINFLAMSAKTESGKSLGLVENLLIDTDNNCIAKYYLKDLLGVSRVLPADDVIKIEKQIIFRNIDDLPPTGVQNAAV